MLERDSDTHLIYELLTEMLADDDALPLRAFGAGAQ